MIGTKSLSILALVAAAAAPALAQSAPDASAERGPTASWVGHKTRAQVYEEVLQARGDGTLDYVGDQPVLRAPAREVGTQTMGYAGTASSPVNGSLGESVSHDGYRLLGDIYVKEGMR